MLFIDFSSAFNTIIPQQLIHKLVQLGLNTSLCSWLLDFLTGRPQAVRVGSNTSSTIILKQGPPKDVCWAPSSSLCWPTTAHRHTTPTASLNLRMTRLWWVSSATEMRQLQERGEPPGRVVQWQQSLSECGEDEGDCRWLQESALSACSSDHQWCDRGESEQHQVPGCTHHRGPLLDQQHCSTSQESTTASLLPPQTKKSQSPAPIMCTFYRGTIESILTSCITVWYGACNASCRKSLQGEWEQLRRSLVSLSPSLQDIYNTRLTRKALSIAGDPTHPTHNFSVCYHQGGDWGVSKPGLKDSFIHQAGQEAESFPPPSRPPLPPPPPPPLPTPRNELCELLFFYLMFIFFFIFFPTCPYLYIVIVAFLCTYGIYIYMCICVYVCNECMYVYVVYVCIIYIYIYIYIYLYIYIIDIYIFDLYLSVFLRSTVSV